NGSALLEGEGWTLWGLAREGAKQGADGTALIRLERIGLADGPGDNRVQADLTTSMYLGDKWEHVFALGAASLRAYADRPLVSGTHWLNVPRESLWLFDVSRGAGPP